MTYNVFAISGEAGIYLRYSGDNLDTAMTIDPAVLCPPTQFYMYFSSGAATMLVNKPLVGVTSAATARIVAVVLMSGTLAGAGKGIVFVNQITGTFQAGETVTGYCVLDTTQIDCQAMGLQAKSALVQVETNSLRFLCDGVPPAASFGMLLKDGNSIEIYGPMNLQRFKIINDSGSANGVANILVRF